MQAVGYIEKSGIKTQRHEKRIYRQGFNKSKKLADNKLPSANGPGQNRVERLFVNFLGDQLDADKNRNHNAKNGNGGQA